MEISLINKAKYQPYLSTICKVKDIEKTGFHQQQQILIFNLVLNLMRTGLKQMRKSQILTENFKIESNQW